MSQSRTTTNCIVWKFNIIIFELKSSWIELNIALFPWSQQKRWIFCYFWGTYCRLYLPCRATRTIRYSMNNASNLIFLMCTLQCPEGSPKLKSKKVIKITTTRNILLLQTIQRLEPIISFWYKGTIQVKFSIPFGGSFLTLPALLCSLTVCGKIERKIPVLKSLNHFYFVRATIKVGYLCRFCIGKGRIKHFVQLIN